MREENRMIQAHEPMIIGDAKNVAVTFENGAKILSLALDNSCGRMKSLRRGDIRLMRRNTDDSVDDVTDDVFACGDSPVFASLENFEKAMNWLRRTNWGFVRQCM